MSRVIRVVNKVNILQEDVPQPRSQASVEDSQELLRGRLKPNDKIDQYPERQVYHSRNWYIDQCECDGFYDWVVHCRLLVTSDNGPLIEEAGDLSQGIDSAGKKSASRDISGSRSLESLEGLTNRVHLLD